MRRKAGVGAGFRAVVVREFVEALQVEGQRAVLAVEFDPQGVLAAGGEPGGLEGREGARGEPSGEQRGVVDRDGPAVAAPGRREAAGGSGQQRPLPYEGLGERGHSHDRLARQVLGEVDDVGAEVAERSRARRLLAKPPGERELPVHQPVLKVGHPDVPQGAETPLGDHLPGE